MPEMIDTLSWTITVRSCVRGAHPGGGRVADSPMAARPANHHAPGTAHHRAAVVGRHVPSHGRRSTPVSQLEMHPDDGFHPPTSDDPSWTETCWFTFTVPERRLSGQLYPF